MALRPFAVNGAVESGPSMSLRSSVELKYDPHLQRNTVMHNGEWLDVASVGDHIAADTLLTMTSFATMTRLPGEVGEGSKLDDDG